MHERALKIVYLDKTPRFETLLKHYKSKSIHIKNLQYLATELFILQKMIVLRRKKILFFKKIKFII